MTDHNESVVIPESLQHLSTPELRKKLQEHGEIPGPITPVTRNVYIKRLARLNSGTTISKVSKLLKLSLLPNPPHPRKVTRISKWIGTFLTPNVLKDCVKLKTSFQRLVGRALLNQTALSLRFFRNSLWTSCFEFSASRFLETLPYLPVDHQDQVPQAATWPSLAWRLTWTFRLLIGDGFGGGKKNRGTVATSRQLIFK